ncbi:MAG: protein phosphatase 2C domain-containing protein [Hespellia sp.]|nr:protein phosphatase 2C domain-containing protein [Hespellia sp.]
MEFLSVVHSDVGIKKSTNQDSVLIKEAITDYGKVLLTVICDGMGGLAKGEVASATLIRTFSDWFEKEFPFILYEERDTKEIDYNSLQRSWNNLIDDVNVKIARYGQSWHAAVGTTLVALLLVDSNYYIVNIGDSRVYIIDTEMRQMTKDQTFVQQQIDQGNITEEQAEHHPQRNVLLQCVGASAMIIPDFYMGTYEKNSIFMLCSDGFRHTITEDEFYKLMNPNILKTEKDMQNAAIYCTELNKQRKENDNISVILVRAC